ncbi:MAG: hypothetical protein LBJ08_12125 [Bifidobacteriaceae bacterium]|jgi:hypothetical protein|nr:hypothetical protein [Bifidobacteriaceae bacterium]
MKAPSIVKASLAAAATGLFVLSGAGAASADATITIPSSHIDIAEIVCALDGNGNPEYEVGTHIEYGGIGDVPNGTSVLSDYLFQYDQSNSSGYLSAPGAFFGNWVASGSSAAEDYIPVIGFHYEPDSALCAQTVTIDVQNVSGSASVGFVSNAPDAGMLGNGSTSTTNSNAVTLGNPLTGSLYAEHVHGTWTFAGLATGQTYPLKFVVSIPGEGTTTLSTAYFRVQP